MKIDKIPKGTRVYIDANIFIYHFGSSHLKDNCTEFLTKVFKGEINGTCSTLTVNEVSHRLMILEIVEKYNIPAKKALKKIKKNPNLIKGLFKYLECTEKIFQMGVEILPVFAEDILESLKIKQKIGLLTNDAMNVVVMKNYEIGNIVTNDSDFERVKDVKVWMP